MITTVALPESVLGDAIRFSPGAAIIYGCISRIAEKVKEATGHYPTASEWEEAGVVPNEQVAHCSDFTIDEAIRLRHHGQLANAIDREIEGRVVSERDCYLKVVSERVAEEERLKDIWVREQRRWLDGKRDRPVLEERAHFVSHDATRVVVREASLAWDQASSKALAEVLAAHPGAAEMGW